MSPWQRAIAVGCAILLLWCTWMFRYDMQAVSPGGEGRAPMAYVLDRWTGTEHVLYTGGRKPLTEAKGFVDMLPLTPPSSK